MNKPNSHSVVILLRDYPELDLQIGDVGLLAPDQADGQPLPEQGWCDAELYSPILRRLVAARVREDDLLITERVEPPGIPPMRSDEFFPPSA